jgi:hypothetical protein
MNFDEYLPVPHAHILSAMKVLVSAGLVLVLAAQHRAIKRLRRELRRQPLDERPKDW